MARCNSCNKFVSHEAELEDESPGSDINGTSISVSAVVNLNCQDCGETLKNCTFDFDEEINHDCQKPGTVVFVSTEGDPEFEVVEEASFEIIDEYESTDKKGKPINPRYQKHFYGVSGTVKVKCCKCDEEIDIDLSDKTPAGSFEDCQ